MGPGITLFAGVTGLIVGSFLNTFIDRWPRGESVLAPPSRCEGCGRRLGPRDLVPVVSWVLSRGRCRTCGGTIGIQAPVVEAGTGLLFAAVAAVSETPAQLLLGLGLVALLVAVTGTDLRCQLIPDVALVAGVAWALLLAAVLGLPGTPWAEWLTRPVQEEPTATGMPDAVLPRSAAKRPLSWLRPPALPPGLGRWGDALAAGLMAGLVFEGIRWASRGGMGCGDVKMAASLGLYLGPGAVAVALFAAAVLGGVVAGFLLVTGRRARGDAVPFGPFLAVGGLVGWFVGEPLIERYLAWAGGF